MWSASWATASTMRPPCIRPMSASRSIRRWTSPRMRPTSSCSSPISAVLERGVREGRRTFGNVMKYVMMGTSSNFGNMFSMAGASLFLPFLPMLPIQILLNNLLYDLSEMPIPMDEVDPEAMAQPPHWDIRFIRNFMLVLGPGQLALRLPDLRSPAPRLRRRARRCSRPAGSSNPWRPRCWSSS